METRTCRTCNANLPLEMFQFRKDTQKYRTECEPCRSLSNKVRLYGITIEYFKHMWKEQEGKCAICEKELEQYSKTHKTPNKACVDHCHTTGKVRGLLCPTCNKALGLFRDNPTYLKKAEEYING